jgi:fructoselysine-6-P-deglycase FrlB-like protein
VRSVGGAGEAAPAQMLLGIAERAVALGVRGAVLDALGDEDGRDVVGVPRVDLRIDVDGKRGRHSDIRLADMPDDASHDAAEFTEPELRPGPPWVMEEMIAAQAELPREIAAGTGAARLGGLLTWALHAGSPILFTGCGTSEHGAQAAAAVVAALGLRSPVAARDAFEAQLDPPDRGLVVAVSHEGGTHATLEAARKAAGAGATVAVVTVRPDRVPPGLDPIGTPRQDRSWCHTIGYTSPLLTVAIAAGSLTADAAERRIAAEMEARGERQAGAERLAGCGRLLAVGSGVDEITARELALKIEEAVHVPTTPLGVEKVLHGHLPAAEPASTGIVLLRFDATHAAERDERAERVARAAAVLGLPVVALRARSPVTSPADALLAGAHALQLLTLELAHVRGTNPDRIRREQEPYRLAAEAAGAG